MESLIVPTITNKSISTELKPTNYHFISSPSIEQPTNNGGPPILANKILTNLYIYWFQVNCINLLLYPVSQSDFPRT